MAETQYRWTTAMKKAAAIVAATGIVLVIGVASNCAARLAAQSHAGRPLDISLRWDAARIIELLPALLVACAAGYAAGSRSRWALFLVPMLTLPPCAFLTYVGKYSAARALAAHAWTGSALSDGLTAF